MTIERQATCKGDTILLRPVKPLEYSGITTSYLEEWIVNDAYSFFILFLVRTDYYCEDDFSSRAEYQWNCEAKCAQNLGDFRN
jgi:hypothetical protein